MSASDHLASWCCTTVLPAPKGPGMAAQPPLPTGKSVSMTLWPVTRGLSMGRLSAKGLGSRTGHFWESVSGVRLPRPSSTYAMGSTTV